MSQEITLQITLEERELIVHSLGLYHQACDDKGTPSSLKMAQRVHELQGKMFNQEYAERLNAVPLSP